MKKILIVLTGILLLGSVGFAEEKTEKETSGYAWGRLEYNSTILSTKTTETTTSAGTSEVTNTKILELSDEHNEGDSDYWHGFMGFSAEVLDMNLDINSYKMWDNEKARTDLYLTKELNDTVTAKLGTTLNNLTDNSNFLSTVVNDATLTLTASKDGTEASMTYAVNGQGSYGSNSGPAVADAGGGIVGGYIKVPVMGFTVVAKPFQGWFNPTSMNLTLGDQFWWAPGVETGYRFFDGIEVSKKFGQLSFNSAWHIDPAEKKETDTTTSYGEINGVDDVTYGSTALTRIGMMMPLGDKINIIANTVLARESAKYEEGSTENTAGRNLIALDGRATVDLSPIKLKGEVQIVSDLRSVEFGNTEGTNNANDIRLYGRADMDMGEFGIYGDLKNETNLVLKETTTDGTTTTSEDSTKNTFDIGGGVNKTIGLVDLELGSGIILTSESDEKTDDEENSNEFYIGTQMVVSF
ncbi:MAG: hypothetical protein ACQERZ_08065 [Fusobacteriota bacterium]